MITLPPNVIPTAILAAILASALRLTERGIAFIFRRRIQQRREKRRWHQDLVELLKEIKFVASSRREALDHWKSKSPDAEETFNTEQLQALRDILEQRGVDEPDQFIAAYARELLNNHQRTVQDDLKNDIRVIENRLLNHLSQYPNDIDEAILEKSGVLLTTLHGMRVTGQINETVEESLWETADDVIQKSNKQIEDLQGWF